MNWNEVEPVGTDTCQDCGEEHELLGVYEEEDTYRCSRCMYDEHGDEFVNEWVLRDVVGEMEEERGELVAFDIGFGIEVCFEVGHSKVPASRNPNETNTVRVPVVDPDAKIRIQDEEVATVRASDWSEYAQEQLRN